MVDEKQVEHDHETVHHLERHHDKAMPSRRLLRDGDQKRRLQDLRRHDEH
jgi:hypothetical protein